MYCDPSSQEVKAANRGRPHWVTPHDHVSKTENRGRGMEKLQTNGCEQGESDLQERAFSVFQFTNLVTSVLLGGTLAEPQLTSGRKHKWQKENGNKSSALPHLRPERSSQGDLVTAPSASKPQKYGGHCSANLPRPLYSLSPREDDRCPQANLTQLH